MAETIKDSLSWSKACREKSAEAAGRPGGGDDKQGVGERMG